MYEETKLQFDEKGNIIYRRDRFDDSFLKDTDLIDIENFNFDSEEYKKAIERIFEYNNNNPICSRYPAWK
jgi:hypothetical protein